MSEEEVASLHASLEPDGSPVCNYPIRPLGKVSYHHITTEESTFLIFQQLSLDFWKFKRRQLYCRIWHIISTAEQCSKQTSIQRSIPSRHLNLLIGLSNQNHSLVIWKADQAGQCRPRQTKANPGRPKQTKADQGRPRQTKVAVTKPAAAKPAGGKNRQKQIKQIKTFNNR